LCRQRDDALDDRFVHQQRTVAVPSWADVLAIRYVTLRFAAVMERAPGRCERHGVGTIVVAPVLRTCRPTRPILGEVVYTIKCRDDGSRRRRHAPTASVARWLRSVLTFL
jgi:hypothetical protein